MHWYIFSDFFCTSIVCRWFCCGIKRYTRNLFCILILYQSLKFWHCDSLRAHIVNNKRQTDQLVQIVFDPGQVGERADGHQAAQSKVKQLVAEKRNEPAVTMLRTETDGDKEV